ncbi:hypothetical protein [Luteimonas terrae]|nr:hypothetical protein [Luteimonas terrae]
MTAIAQYTLAEIPAEKLYVRTFALAHNGIDRDNECFDEALLADFARTLPGKGLFIKHPTGWDGDSGPGKGRWFGAKLERMSLDEARALLREPGLKFPPGVETGVVLMADAYLVRTTGNADLLDEIDAGVVGDVSIGFTYKDSERVVDVNGIELNIWRLTSPGEASEGSLVWLGAQPGARAIKHANRTEDRTMPTEEQYQAEKSARTTAETKATALQAELDQAKPSHDIVLGLRKALGDNAALIDKPDDLAASVKAAAVYRDELIDTIVKQERQLGLCDDDDESVAAAKAIYAGDPLTRLQGRAKRLEAQATKGGRMPPSGAHRGQEPAPTGEFAENPAFG